MFRNKHPYFLFTYSKILHCFIHRKHIFFPNWNLTFFNFNRHSSFLLFSLNKTFLSAHDNLQFYILSSADKITGGSSVLCPHRFCTVIKYDQIFSGSIIITDMLRRPVQLLHILSNSSRSIPLLQCYISAFPRIYSINRADISWRIYLVALHIFTSCMQNNIQFSRYKNS